jgi:pimeloyl-ACP methyl ester carboxylesterase
MHTIINAIIALVAVAVPAALAQTVPASVRGQPAPLPGVRLWYLDTAPGDATRPVVVLLHANTGTSESWALQFEPFARAGFRVIAFDRRGWGRSMADPSTGPQPGTIAEDLHALVEHLQIPRFHLVGVAGGTFAALDYAAWRSDRLLSLVAGASTGAIADDLVRGYSARIRIPALSGPANVHLLEVSPSFRGSHPEGVERWLEIHHHARQDGAPAQPQRSPNTLEKISGIRARTLILPGDVDLIAPPDLMRLWGGYIPNAQWAVIPNAGHSINWEEPETFNGVVLRFLKGERFEPVKPQP